MNNIRRNLKRIRTPWHRFAVGSLLSALAILGRAYLFLASITPRRALLPVTLLQLLLAMQAVHVGGETGVEIFAVGSLVLVGIALVPLLLRTAPAQQYHWIYPPGLILEKK